MSSGKKGGKNKLKRKIITGLATGLPGLLILAFPIMAIIATATLLFNAAESQSQLPQNPSFVGGLFYNPDYGPMTAERIAQEGWSMDKYLDYAVPLAVVYAEKWGILPSIMLAQSIGEAGMPNNVSYIGRTCNNIFGIKRYQVDVDEYVNVYGGTPPESADIESGEGSDGHLELSQFCVFPNLEACFDYYGFWFTCSYHPHYAAFRAACSQYNYDAALDVLNRHYATSGSYKDLIRRVMDSYDLKQYDNKEKYNSSMYRPTASAEWLKGMPIQWPVSNPVVGDGYPAYNDGAPHCGLDFPLPAGTPVYAIADGIVVTSRTGYSNHAGTPGYGNTITLMHSWKGATFYSRYAHLTDNYVSVGEQIHVGQNIGTIGNTGNSYGAHLHLETRTDLYESGTVLTNTFDPRSILP